MSEAGVDDGRLEARFARIESALDSAIQDKLAMLGAELQARSEAKLSGNVLAAKSGALIASLVLEPESGSKTEMMHVAARGVAYAHIQEFGGKTAAHEILPLKAQALAFVADGKTGFAKHLHHPGSTIPAHGFMRGSLDEMRDEIVGALKTVVAQTMQTA